MSEEKPQMPKVTGHIITPEEKLSKDVPVISEEVAAPEAEHAPEVESVPTETPAEDSVEADDPLKGKYTPSQGMIDEVSKNSFFPHELTQDQKERVNIIRGTALIVTRVLLAHTPDGPEQSKAIESLREFVMWAGAAIECGESEHTKAIQAKVAERMKAHGEKENQKAQ